MKKIQRVKNVRFIECQMVWTVFVKSVNRSLTLVFVRVFAFVAKPMKFEIETKATNLA